MAEQLHFHPSLHPGSLRPNIYSHKSSSSRVTSDPDKKSSQPHTPKHKSHRHHQHHHERHHRHSSSRRHAAREAVQSALQIEPPTSLGDLLKQARGGGSKDTSPGHSRKASVVLDQALEALRSTTEDDEITAGLLRRDQVRAEEVERETRRNKARERDLRSALQNLSNDSLRTSRRLDDTYYSILEKVSVLRQTIGSLQELSGLTKELHENFESESKELTEEVEGQFEGFDSFTAQQSKISDLEKRINEGREKADSLTARLSKAKAIVDARAVAEAKYEANVTRRLRFFWAVLGSIGAVILAIFLFHQVKNYHAPGHPRAPEFAARSAILDAPIPEIAKDAIISLPTKSAVETSLARPLLPDDEHLRGFDEL